MKLSNNFNYEEFFVSAQFPEIAKKDLAQNKNNKDLATKLEMLCHICAQPIREYVKNTVKINSGFRSEELNSKIKGSKNSDHKLGLAADLSFPGQTDLLHIYKWAIRNACYRQIILYPLERFIHISINWPNTKYLHEALVKNGDQYTPWEEI